jgi:septal ring factor EnvC (AmiA/AmiB activator)
MKSLRLVCALAAMMAAHAAVGTVLGQTQPVSKQPISIVPSTATQQNAPPKGQGTNNRSGIVRSTPPTMEYDLGHMSKRIAALAEQIEALKKENQALSNKLAQLQQRQPATAQNAAALKQLDAAFRSHTHYMPEIGQMALSAVPGMQDMANKLGLGALKAQWDTFKVLWKTGNGGLGTVGPPIQQQ